MEMVTFLCPQTPEGGNLACKLNPFPARQPGSEMEMVPSLPSVQLPEVRGSSLMVGVIADVRGSSLMGESSLM